MVTLPHHSFSAPGSTLNFCMLSLCWDFSGFSDFLPPSQSRWIGSATFFRCVCVHGALQWTVVSWKDNTGQDLVTGDERKDSYFYIKKYTTMVLKKKKTVQIFLVMYSNTVDPENGKNSIVVRQC